MRSKGHGSALRGRVIRRTDTTYWPKDPKDPRVSWRVPVGFRSRAALRSPGDGCAALRRVRTTGCRRAPRGGDGVLYGQLNSRLFGIHPTLSCPPTSSGPRWPLAALASARGRHRRGPRRLLASRLARLGSCKATDELFVRADGRPFTRATLDYLVSTWFRRAGVAPPPGSLGHALRHTYATLLVDNGTSLPELQRLLGHRDLSTTQVYLAVTGAGLEQTAVLANPARQLLRRPTPPPSPDLTPLPEPGWRPRRRDMGVMNWPPGRVWSLQQGVVAGEGRRLRQLRRILVTGLGMEVERTHVGKRATATSRLAGNSIHGTFPISRTRGRHRPPRSRG